MKPSAAATAARRTCTLRYVIFALVAAVLWMFIMVGTSLFDLSSLSFSASPARHRSARHLHLLNQRRGGDQSLHHHHEGERIIDAVIDSAVRDRHHHDHIRAADGSRGSTPNAARLGSASPAAAPPLTTAAPTTRANQSQQQPPPTTMIPPLGSGRPPFEFSWFDRVFCVDMHLGGSPGANIPLFRQPNLLSIVHACQLLDAWVLPDLVGGWPPYGQVRRAITLVVAPDSQDVDAALVQQQLELRRREPNSTTATAASATPVQAEKTRAGKNTTANTTAAASSTKKPAPPPPAPTNPVLRLRPPDYHAQSAEFQFPRTPFGVKYVSIVEQKDTRDFYVPDKAPMLREVNVAFLIGSHYNFFHPVHSLESYGELMMALDRWLKPAPPNATAAATTSSSSSSSSPTSSTRTFDLFAANESHLHFDKVDLVLLGSKIGTDQTKYPYQAVKAILWGAYARAGWPPERSLVVDVTTVPPKFPRIRAQRMISVGARYDIFDSPADGVQFRQDLHSYFSYRWRMKELGEERAVLLRQKTKRPVGAATSGAASSNSALELAANSSSSSSSSPPPPPPPPPIRHMAFFERGGKSRIIVDGGQFVSFLRLCAAFANATLSALRAGKMDVRDLWHTLKDAQVAIGMHGADLGNVVFMDRVRPLALVELNPCLFWEPRFYGMAGRLGVAYFAWNCGSPTCAFGGNPQEFKNQVLAQDLLKYDERTRRIYSADTSKHNVSAVWPARGFVGAPETCGKSCLDLIGKTRLRARFMSSYRSSNVRLMSDEHPREIAMVAFDAFVAVGWVVEAQRAAFWSFVADLALRKGLIGKAEGFANVTAEPTTSRKPPMKVNMMRQVVNRMERKRREEKQKRSG